MPPMSMHSIGHAWAHWKHVSHFSVPYSSYSSWSRPRNLCGTSRRTSGYLIVAFGSKNFRSVRPMPMTMPRPGRRIIDGSSCRVTDEDEGQGGHEQVEERRRQEPLPGEAHQLVDPDAGQRAAHPDEREDEDIALAEEPQQAGDPVEADEREAADDDDREQVEQHEADDQRLPGGHRAPSDEERRGQDERRHHGHDRDQQRQPDTQRSWIEA